jgi:hypothetical protein
MVVLEITNFLGFFEGGLFYILKILPAIKLAPVYNSATIVHNHRTLLYIEQLLSESERSTSVYNRSTYETVVAR